MVQRKKGLSKVQAKAVKRIAESVVKQDSEVKYLQTDLGIVSTLPYTGYSFEVPLHEIVQGPLNANRIGSQLDIQSLDIRGMISANGNTGLNVRMMLVEYDTNTDPGNDPLPGFIPLEFPSTSGNPWRGLCSKYAHRRENEIKYKILYDQLTVFDSNSNIAMRPFHIHVSGKQLMHKGRVTYVETGDRSIHDAPLYLIAFSETGAGAPAAGGLFGTTCYVNYRDL